MIINPSSHTMIPRGNTFRNRYSVRRRRALSLPGGKMLWDGVTKALFCSSVLLFVCSFWLTGAVEQVNEEIEQTTAIHNELLNSNILLRGQKARLFSPEEVGKVAGQGLALYLPASGQYRKF